MFPRLLKKNVKFYFQKLNERVEQLKNHNENLEQEKIECKNLENRLSDLVIIMQSFGTYYMIPFPDHIEWPSTPPHMNN